MHYTAKKFILGAAVAATIALPLTAHAADATSFNPTTVKVTAKPISSIPVGTIISWPVAQNPADWQNPDGSYNWLECNGQTISQTAYPELFALLGGRVPDLRGRVAWGDAVPGRNIEAGLPNITGDMYFEADNFFSENGALSARTQAKVGYQRSGSGTMMDGIIFDASRSNPCYGRSQTVQPPAYTVRFLVRARP